MSTREQTDPDFEALIQHIQQARGLDFRGYKRTSLRRRVSLRMEEVGCSSFDEYQSFLEVHPQEYVELLNTVLINVTSFLRDTEAWETLRSEVVPRIVARSQPNDPIRVWSVGCASGEEPYSVAMLFAEALGIGEFCRRVKIYATDLDEHALGIARHAVYPAREVEALPPAMRERYFEHSGDHYTFQRELRKCVIFGRHNVVFDAPISRIDLLLCRNLLIYLETETQNVVLPRLHYALVDEGYLFLGKAETQLARSKLFRAVDIKHRIFSKLPQEWRRSAGGSLMLGADTREGASQQARMVEGIVDASPIAYLAVDPMGTLIFANTAARRLLDVGEADIGRPFQDLPISYRPSELRGRIEEAQQHLRTVRIEHQEYHRPPGDPLRVSIEVMPLTSRNAVPYATLLSFTDTTRLYQLQQELEAAQESLETTIEELQSANEELETTNEELQSTNEELETTNEELQSTNEELETMNEELRSTNDELEAANGELRHQTEDAIRYRSHSESVLRSINAGVMVLDLELKVHSWNRWSENAWGLRREDVIGLPFLALDIGLPVQRLEAAIEQIRKHGEGPLELELEALDRRGRLLKCNVRLSPLLYDDRSIHGVVIIVEDATDRDQREEYTRRLGRVLGRSLNEIYFLDPETLRFTLINQGAEKKLGYGIAELRQRSLADLMPQVPAAGLQALVQPLLARERSEVVFETTLRSQEGREYPVEICMQYFADERPPLLLAIVHDTTERQRLQD